MNKACRYRRNENLYLTMKLIGYLSWILILVIGVSEAFQATPRTTSSVLTLRKPLPNPLISRVSPLYFFGRDNKANDDEGAEKEEKKGSIPFFGRIRQKVEDKPDATTTNTVPVVEVTPLPSQETAQENVILATPKEDVEDPTERAKALRAQAQRARLEAERMDAELTLEKIERLERQLKNAKTKGESIEELQQQLDNLEAKLRGEQPKIIVPKRESPTKANDKTITSEKVEPILSTETSLSKSKNNLWMGVDLNDYVSSDSFEEAKRIIDVSPDVLRKLLASLVEIDYDTATDINTTELALRMVMVRDGDFSYSKLPKPVFTEAEIEETIRSLDLGELECPENIVLKAAGNTRAMAEYVLETEYYFESKLATADDLINVLSKAGEDDILIKSVIDVLNATAMDQYINAIYPKCTRKENAQEPTMAQIQSLVTNVLPKVKFTPTAKPEKVAGGYAITGSYNMEKGGDALITAIDKELAKIGLADKMTVLLTDDFLTLAKAAETDSFDLNIFGDDDAPMLYITAPDIVRDPQPVPLSIVSGLGLATSWYLSIYPFLLNQALSQRVEEQLAVADAGMTYDLEWLTDLSVPLFVSFMGLQLIHEIGHRISAARNNIKITLPTFVPSLVTGITSSVTTFKDLPKNNDAMFDFAVSGPLLGFLASLVSLVVGAQLTLSSDPATLPCLPVDILRQSTLGGSVVDTIIQGALYVPDGAPSAGLMVSLHPLAVAGYISLIVNALALLPVGTTDGGRMAVALFGRNPKTALGYFTMFVLLAAGVLGSDLFLFYFAFIIAFQSGNEVPARNEFDGIAVSRLIVGAVAYALAFLTLVPIQ